VTGRADLVAAFPGFIRAPTTQDEVAELLTRCVVELHPDDAAAFLAEWNAGDWEMLAAVHPYHAELDELVAWADGLDDVILLVAFAAPPPPAVFVVERDRG
jgi:hypothetical protein